MGRIWPMASAFRAWRPVKRGLPTHLLPWTPTEAARPAPSDPWLTWPACALAGVARTGCMVPRAWPARWHGRQRLTGGREATKSSVRAPPLSGVCVGQGDWRQGSPKQRRDVRGWSGGAGGEEVVGVGGLW
jgi:hypothetical protein